MRCIYCQNREADSEEHLLPRGLGRFPAPFLPAKGLLCHPCNVKYGNELIAPLLQKGFYSQARRKVPWRIGRATRKNRPQGAGYEMPFTELEGVEGKFLVESDLGHGTGRAARQLVFKETNGSMTPWLVPAYIQTSDALRTAIERAGHKGKVLATFWYGPGDVLPDLLREMYPNQRIELRDPMRDGQVFSAVREYEVSVVQRRAIVMVAFHLFLAIYRARGDEPEFRGVREFIDGDDQEWGPLSANLENPTLSPLGPMHDAVPDRPKHIFACGKTDAGQMVVDLRLFANEENSTWWKVLVASANEEPAQTCVGALVYYEGGPKEIDGRVLDGFVIAPRRKDRRWEFGRDALENLPPTPLE